MAILQCRTAVLASCERNSYTALFDDYACIRGQPMKFSLLANYLLPFAQNRCLFVKTI
jgi:hypothetical protein